MKNHCICLLAVGMALTLPAQAWKGTSPDGRLMIEVNNGRCTLNCGNQQVLQILVGGGDDSVQGGMVNGQSSMVNGAPSTHITADYQMLTGKRLHCTNEANEYQAEGITFRLYNDGLAFRNETPVQGDLHSSQFAYIIPEGTKRWMQQWTDSYEGFFPLTTSYKVAPVPSFSGVSKSAEGWNNRWGYPALIEASPSPSEGSEPLYALITEANIERGQSASCLYNDGEVFRVVPDKTTPGSKTDGHSPWRVVIVGTLGQIVESTLVTDVSEPSQISDTSWIHPGTVSWIYWAYNHGSNDYNIIKKYVDMAATLRLPYVLIDAEWDEMDKVATNEGKTVEDAVAYALAKGVKPMIWYNSSVGWVDGAPGPKFRLNKPEDREREFAWCEKIGVAGVKIDFFSGDTQLNMDYCIDLLECAARHHLLVNFHGATIPRGWQRTWPNLMSTEGVYGAEWYNNVPTFTDRAAAHNATLPFTRNVIGPMDYTPCAFSDSQHPHITTHAHELALTVLFESSLQHLADRPESFLAQPQQVQDFLGQLPTVWDETRFLTGYPGQCVALARRSGNTWYVAGINGTDEPLTIDLPSDLLPSPSSHPRKIDSFTDNTAGSTSPWLLQRLDTLPTKVQCLPRGGFVFIKN